MREEEEAAAVERERGELGFGTVRQGSSYGGEKQGGGPMLAVAELDGFFPCDRQQYGEEGGDRPCWLARVVGGLGWPCLPPHQFFCFLFFFLSVSDFL